MSMRKIFERLIGIGDCAMHLAIIIVVSLLPIVSVMILGGAVFVTPSTIVHDHSTAGQGGINLNCAAPCSSRVCATGFTRLSLNFCLRNNLNAQAWTNTIACTQTSFTGIALPASATMAMVRFDWVSLSNNVVGTRSNTLLTYTTNGCINPSTSGVFVTQEQIAVTAGTQLTRQGDTVLVPLCATNSICTTQANGGGNGNSSVLNIQVLGYYD